MNRWKRLVVGAAVVFDLAGVPLITQSATHLFGFFSLIAGGMMSPLYMVLERND